MLKQIAQQSRSPATRLWAALSPPYTTHENAVFLTDLQRKGHYWSCLFSKSKASLRTNPLGVRRALLAVFNIGVDCIFCAENLCINTAILNKCPLFVLV